MTSNFKKYFYNIFFGIGGQILIAAIGIVVPRLFISSYGSEVNGFLSSINQIFTYVVILEAGVGTATLQALYKPVATENHDEVNGILSATAQFYRKTGWYYLACIALLSVGYPILVASEIPFWQQMLIIWIVGGSGSIGYFVHAKYRMLLGADGKMYIFTNMHTLVQLGTSITKIVMIALGLNIVFVQLGHMLLMLVQSAYITRYTKKHYPWINLKVQPNKEAISQKNSVLVHEISQMVFNHTDVLILTIFTDLKVVSVYVLYNMIVDMISTLIGNVHNSFSFRLGQIFNTNKERYKQVYDVYETGYMMLSMSLYCVTFLCLLPFMRLYTAGIEDANYLDQWLPLLFVAIKILVSGRALAGATISYAGKFNETKNRSLTEMIINLAVSFVCVYLLGIYGVLLGTLAALLYRANDMIIYTRRHILEQSPWKTYSKWLVDIGVFIAIAVVTKQYFPINTESYFTLIVYAAAYTAVTFVVYALVNLLFFRRYVIPIIEYVKNILLKRRTGRKKNKSKKCKWILIIVITLFVIATCAELIASNYWLKTTSYKLQTVGIESEVNIVFLSDLHNRSFGKDNSYLINEVSEASPDVIAVVGDMMEEDSTDEELNEYLDLLTELVKIAPTFVSYGNHDFEYEAASGVNLVDAVKGIGAVLLEEEYVDFPIGDSTVRIGGMYTYAFAHHQTAEEWLESSTYRFLSEFEDTDLPTVLLCHRPDSFFYNDAYLNWDIDAIVCGHTHGGMVRVPFVGGVIAPDQLLFPEYDYGSYQLDDTLMIIGGGLSGYGMVPRVFNRPEIATLTLIP